MDIPKKSGKNRVPVIRIILIILLVIVLFLGIFIARTSSVNVKAMNQSVEAALSELSSRYTLTPVDPGKYSDLKLFGLLKFDVDQYAVEELGNLSIMRINIGPMQMSTFVITPKDKNMPLFSADYMYILGNRKAYLEFYDVVKEKDADYEKLLTALSNVQDTYSYIADFEVEPAWYEHLLTVVSYKSATSKEDTDIQNFLRDSVAVYADHAKQLPSYTEEARAEKIALTIEYTDGLIERGGVSTDVFKQALGAEETKNFFDQVFFGTLAE